MEAKRMSPSQRQVLWIVIAVILLLIIIGLILWAVLAHQVATATVARRDVILTVASRGDVVAPPSAQADVYANNNAPVNTVNVTLNGPVRRGQVMVQLYYPSVAAAQQQAQVQVQQAQQAYNQAQQTYAQRLAQARRELASAQQDVRAARQAQASAAGPAPTSATGRVRAGVVLIQAAPDQDQDQAAAPSLDQAVAREQAAEQDYAQAQQDMQAGLQPYRDQLQAAQAALAQARAGALAAEIRSPITGTVVVLNAVPGQTLTSTTDEPPLVARVVDLTKVQVSAPLTDAQAALIQPAMPVSLTFDELPHQQFTGRVSRITSSPQQASGATAPQFLALVSFDNSSGQVRPNMHAHASIVAGRENDALAVPNAAVKTDSQGRTVVYVRQGREWQPVTVVVGLRGTAYTEIRSGLQEGQEIRL